MGKISRIEKKTRSRCARSPVEFFYDEMTDYEMETWMKNLFCFLLLNMFYEEWDLCISTVTWLVGWLVGRDWFNC